MCSDLNTICANLNTSPFIHVKKIASIVGQIISLAQNCGNVTQIMTRFLHIVINSTIRMLLECMVQDVHIGHLSRCFFSSPSSGFNWICPGCLDNRMLRRIFSGTLLILMTVPLTVKSVNDLSEPPPFQGLIKMADSHRNCPLRS